MSSCAQGSVFAQIQLQANQPASLESRNVHLVPQASPVGLGFVAAWTLPSSQLRSQLPSQAPCLTSKQEPQQDGAGWGYCGLVAKAQHTQFRKTKHTQYNFNANTIVTNNTVHGTGNHKDCPTMGIWLRSWVNSTCSGH